MFFEVKLIIADLKMAIFVDSNGFRSEFWKKWGFFGFIDLDEEMYGFENVIFFHELLAIFLKSDEFIKRDEIMVGFDKVKSLIEVFVNK